MDTLRADFLRFSRLHSWYKHLPIGGIEFFAFQAIGQQPRNGFHPDIKDSSGIHWHFSYSEPDVPFCKVRFGPFLQGVHVYDFESTCKRIAYAFDLIMKCNETTFIPWIAEHHPQWAHLSWEDWNKKSYDFEDPIVVELYEKETEKYWNALVKAVGAKN